jgi:hypothetical protein
MFGTDTRNTCDFPGKYVEQCCPTYRHNFAIFDPFETPQIRVSNAVEHLLPTILFIVPLAKTHQRSRNSEATEHIDVKIPTQQDS